uniref:Uncharacterized protein n=1 Tax=Romanomermis culicivorax TaxID=13658 RepID=A0A915JV16_ROMCU
MAYKQKNDEQVTDMATKFAKIFFTKCKDDQLRDEKEDNIQLLTRCLTYLNSVLEEVQSVYVFQSIRAHKRDYSVAKYPLHAEDSALYSGGTVLTVNHGARQRPLITCGTIQGGVEYKGEHEILSEFIFWGNGVSAMENSMDCSHVIQKIILKILKINLIGLINRFGDKRQIGHTSV